MEFLLSVVFVAQLQKPGRPTDPPPVGQRLEAKDGDTVVIRGDAHVRIVYRRDARIRAIHNGEQRWIAVLVDYADPQKGAADGFVDQTYSFFDVDGTWPLGDRWEGNAVLDDYTMLDTAGGSLGITTDAGLVQLLAFPPDQRGWFIDSRGTALYYRGSGRGNSSRQTFDQAEARVFADAERRVQQRAGNGVLRLPAEPWGPLAPVRVGGNVVQPTKIADAKPVLPPLAESANVRGVVIAEIVVGVDGSVTHARILRSIPLLDQAALDAVRQWRYEVTRLNGQAVPVVMTVSVPFS